MVDQHECEEFKWDYRPVHVHLRFEHLGEQYVCVCVQTTQTKWRRMRRGKEEQMQRPLKDE